MCKDSLLSRLHWRDGWLRPLRHHIPFLAAFGLPHAVRGNHPILCGSLMPAGEPPLPTKSPILLVLGTTSLEPMPSPPFLLPWLSGGGRGSAAKVEVNYVVFRRLDPPQARLQLSPSPFNPRDPQLTSFSVPKQKHIQQNWCWKGTETRHFKAALLKDNSSKIDELSQPGYLLLDVQKCFSLMYNKHEHLPGNLLNLSTNVLLV